MKPGSRKKSHSFGKRVDVPGGRREKPRANIRLSVSLHAIDCSHPVTLLDLSRTGAKMSMPEPMHRGQQVWLKTDTVQLFGFVCWVRGQTCGIRFDEPLRDWHLSQLRLKGQVLVSRGRSLDERFAAAEWQTSLIR